MIPISVIVMTKNEALNLPYSLPLLTQIFDDVWVVDSDSSDDTVVIAKSFGAHVENFTWNDRYPKKKQWCLDNIKTEHDWVLMVDADEIITDDFISALKALNFSVDGYFVSSTMVWKDKKLKHGARNNKLCLFKKSSFYYPEIDDLDINGGWEVEGHYQPIAKNDDVTLGQIKSTIIHHDRKETWAMRHDNYVTWEAEMIRRNAFPVDPIFWRQCLKSLTRVSWVRPYIHFVYGYILKFGFLDGCAGFDYAVKRFNYNRRIICELQHEQARHPSVDET